MIKIASTQLWVHDQDEALAFYTQKVGVEVRADVTLPEMGNFRWLTVGPPGQEDVAIVLMAIPGPPMFEAETIEQVKALMAKGVRRHGVPHHRGLPAPTTRSSAAAASSSSRSPRSGPYGIDSGFRDPSGNHIRLTQVSGAGDRAEAPPRQAAERRRRLGLSRAARRRSSRRCRRPGGASTRQPRSRATRRPCRCRDRRRPPAPGRSSTSARGPVCSPRLVSLCALGAGREADRAPRPLSRPSGPRRRPSRRARAPFLDVLVVVRAQVLPRGDSNSSNDARDRTCLAGAGLPRRRPNMPLVPGRICRVVLELVPRNVCRIWHARHSSMPLHPRSRVPAIAA